MSTSGTVCSFTWKKAWRRGRRKSAKKALFKKERLCYSVEEAEGRSLYRLSGIASARANRQKQSRKQGFKLRWRYIPQEEIAANMYSSGEVDRIRKLRTALLNDYVRGNQLREVVHSEFCKDLLVNVLHLFCVEMNEAERVFEMAEGSLNTPSSGIEEFKLSRRECVGREIGHDGFKRRI